MTIVNYISICRCFRFFFTSFSQHNSLGRDMTPPNASIMSATSSVSSLSIDSSSSGHNKATSASTYQLVNIHVKFETLLLKPKNLY